MNLLIVDDEYLVVEEVVTVTDWELLGITEIYSATNAVSAVRILNEKKIDIMTVSYTHLTLPTIA